MYGKIQIDPDALLKAMKEVQAGRFAYIESTDFYRPYSETKPIEGYEKYMEQHGIEKKFPNCCVFHKSLVEYANKAFTDFPSCCDAHKKLLETKWFDKKEFEYLPQKLIDTISFTEYHIWNKADTEDWYNDITEYIEYSWLSFGQLRANYGPPAGAESFFNTLKIIIESYAEMEDGKKQKLINFFYRTNPTEKQAELTDINILVDAYKRWHKTFPFELSYFRDLKNKLSGLLPFLADKPTFNRYTKTGKSKLVTNKQLLTYLIDLTNEILNSIKSTELVTQGNLSDNEIQRIELINEKHKIEQTSLLNEFSKDENRYVKIIKKWLANEKEYYKDVMPLLELKENEMKKINDKNSLKPVLKQMEQKLSADEHTKQMFEFIAYLCKYKDEGIEFKIHLDNSFLVTKEIAEENNKLLMQETEKIKNLYIDQHGIEKYNQLLECDANYFNNEIGTIQIRYELNKKVENKMIERFCIRRWQEEKLLYTAVRFLEREIKYLCEYHDKIKEEYKYQFYPILKFFEEAAGGKISLEDRISGTGKAETFVFLNDNKPEDNVNRSLMPDTEFIQGLEVKL